MTATLPDCAIPGHHTRDAHRTHCRPAIDAVWTELSRRRTYGTDATGSRARWYAGGMTLPEALADARAHIRHAPDTATVYRYPIGRAAAGPSEPIARYQLRRDDAEPWRLTLYVTRPDGRTYRIRRVRRAIADRFRV